MSVDLVRKKHKTKRERNINTALEETKNYDLLQLFMFVSLSLSLALLLIFLTGRKAIFTF
jgi:hypothetical protein